MVKKCFDFLRPYLAELTSESKSEFGDKGLEASVEPRRNLAEEKSHTSDTKNDTISQRYVDLSKKSKTNETGPKDTSDRVGEKKKSVFQIFSKYNGSSKSKENGHESAETLR